MENALEISEIIVDNILDRLGKRGFTDKLDAVSSELYVDVKADLVRLTKETLDMRPSVAIILKQAQVLAEEKRKMGWTKKDFANALKEMFEIE